MRNAPIDGCLNLLAESVDGFIVTDNQGIILQSNTAAAALFGYADGALNGKPITILMLSPDRERHPGCIASFNRDEPSTMVGTVSEVQGVKRDGSLVDISISVATVDTEPEPRFAAIVRDQSKKKQAERTALSQLKAEIAERTRRLEHADRLLAEGSEELERTTSKLDLVYSVIERINQAVVITDSDNHIVYVNPAYERMTGFSPAVAQGQNPGITNSGRHSKEFYQEMWQSLFADGHWEGEIWDRRKDGSVYLKYLSIDLIRDRDGRIVNHVAMFQDLTERKRTEAELERLQHYDALTGLPNRVLFQNRLHHEFEVASRRDARTGLMLINLDRFRTINETFGFAVGDSLLAAFAERLGAVVRRTDMVARKDSGRDGDPYLVSRMAGDVFAMILSEMKRPEDAGIVAHRLLAAMEEPFRVPMCDEAVYLHSSIGIAVYPDSADNPDELVRRAESALDQAKKNGRSQYRFFSDHLNTESARRVRLETKMRTAFAAEKFILHYQPKLNLASGRITGAEALIRWPLNGGGMISPGDFIPLAEETGMILPLGSWILRRACTDAAALNAAGHRLSMAVNLSARQFLHEDLTRMVSDVLAETGLSPDLLELEITESMVMGDVERAASIMKKLRALGVHLAIDDFGTGYSSLSYLKSFPVNTLKIDQCFVRTMEKGSQDAAIAETVVTLGRTLGLSVVAEGVETTEQLALLKAMGCHYGQGFHIARPAGLEALQAALDTNGMA